MFWVVLGCIICFAFFVLGYEVGRKDTVWRYNIDVERVREHEEWEKTDFKILNN
jgi:hypothetical protein